MAQGISIHVIDIARGVVAEGMRVDVSAVAPNARLIAAARVGADAIAADAALAERFAPGEYELAFHVAAFYRGAGVTLPGVPFLDLARHRVRIARADRHYHFPFKMTPWGYSLFITVSG